MNMFEELDKPEEEQPALAELLEDKAVKTVGISLNTEKDYHWVWYKGSDNMSLGEAKQAWVGLTDWVANRASQMSKDFGDPQIIKNVLNLFARKLNEIGEQEYSKLKKEQEPEKKEDSNE